jgi:diguanylate cyclase (GGDEF)-like protein
MTAGTAYTAYLALLLLSAMLAAWLASVAWRRRHAPAASALTVLLVGVIWWSLSFALLLVFEPARLFWFKLMFVGVVAVPAAFFVFALQFTGFGHRATRTVLLLLAIEPVLVQMAIWTDPMHGLFLGGYDASPGTRFVGGIGFWLHSIYSYLLLMAAIALIALRCVRAPSIQRRQARLILLGALVPLAANAVTILRLIPWPWIDLTPIGFAVTSGLNVFALFRYGLLDLIPVAREAIVERMTDAVLVLDADDRIIDVNPAAAAMLRLDARPLFGAPADAALADWPDVLAACSAVTDFQGEVQLRDDGRCVDMRVTPLAGERNSGARLVVLRDVSRLKHIESELRDTNRQLRQKLTEIEELQKRLTEQAIRDSLTGLYNRRFLEESLARELAKAQRAQNPLSVAVIDLDHFKRVNDAHGHRAGDRLLIAVGDLLRSYIRGGDVACRYGGEEFVVVMPGASLEVAAERAETWRFAFAKLKVAADTLDLNATFTAGVACYPLNATSAERLLDAADQAMYSAKAAGRDRVAIALATKPPNFIRSSPNK